MGRKLIARIHPLTKRLPFRWKRTLAVKQGMSRLMPWHYFWGISGRYSRPATPSKMSSSWTPTELSAFFSCLKTDESRNDSSWVRIAKEMGTGRTWQEIRDLFNRYSFIVAFPSVLRNRLFISNFLYLVFAILPKSVHGGRLLQTILPPWLSTRSRFVACLSLSNFKSSARSLFNGIAHWYRQT